MNLADGNYSTTENTEESAAAGRNQMNFDGHKEARKVTKSKLDRQYLCASSWPLNINTLCIISFKILPKKQDYYA